MNDAQQQDSQEAAGDCRIPSPFQKKTCWYALTGVAILVISSELSEVIGIADRIVVMREGVITGEVGGATGIAPTQENIIGLATGVTAPVAA